MSKDNVKTVPHSMKFVFGGTAGMMATCVVQPFDLVKTRMQTMTVKGESGSVPVKPSSLSVLRGVVKNEGVFTLYNGLSAALLRQATYTTTRLGVYTWLFEKSSSQSGSPPGFLMKAGLGMTAGATGAFVGTPAEVALIRMTSDGNLPKEQRRNYTSVFNALSRIVREEGVPALFRGATPTMGRAMVVNAAQLASYSQAKQVIMDSGYFQEGVFLHFVASMISGVITTLASMPVDMAKTRIQNMKKATSTSATSSSIPQYTGPIDVLVKVARNEGILALWKGSLPYYLRLAPHTVLTFILLEQMNVQYKLKVLGLTPEQAKGGGL